jgi:ATP-dependent protease HslVU (ClpYQ) peptidase subunit
MTTIAAAAQDGAVYMAADTMTNVYDRPIYGARKIRRLTIGDDEALIAFAGSGAMIGVVGGLVIDPEQIDEDDDHVTAQALAVAVSELAVERGIVEDGKMDGTALLGYRGRLWTLTHMQSIAHDEPHLAALGSGEGPAMGAMTALIGRCYEPGQAVIDAVRIAIRLDRYSGGEVYAEMVSAAV